MSVLDSLFVDGFGFAIVFIVLIALSLIIKLISVIIGSIKKDNKTSEEKTQEAVLQPAGKELPYADGELKLYDVDEKTAALIMAIVSDESKIPLSQLQFKSIRLMKKEVSV